MLSLLEQSLSELVKSNAQSDLADGLRRATEADVAAVPVVEVRFNPILIRFNPI